MQSAYRRALLTLLLCVALPLTGDAASLRSVRTVKAEPGRISDAALDSAGRLYLCYPDAGYVAQYGPDARLLQFIRREAGVEKPFHPASCIIGEKNLLYVFDEAAREVLVISPDGNQQRSYPLAYPVDGKPLALSRIGHLLPTTDGVWALLPDRSRLCRFDSRGALKEQLDLAAMLPYPAGSYGRAQWLDDGTLLVLDYNQGAVLYRTGPTATFRRLSLTRPTGVEALPAAQDFAADDAGRILLLAAGGKPEAVLLTKEAKGYASASLQLPASLSGQRLGCRSTGGGFIVWPRDGGIVWLCTAQ